MVFNDYVLVIPVKAVIQYDIERGNGFHREEVWIPACAG